VQSALFFLNTLWLFTLSDIKTFVIPQTVFGIFSALAGPVMTTNPSPQLLPILTRAVHVFLWTWLNTLIFVLANQSLPESVKEDFSNKPSRPIPSGRITASQARQFLLFSIPTIVLLTLYLGASEETVALLALDWMYNDLGGANENYIIRNLINGLAFVTYSLGATKVACGSTFSLNSAGYQWLAIQGAIIFSTLQVQDLKDQAGDLARGRSTVPLVLGDTAARWTIAIPVMVWSAVCPTFWALNRWTLLAPLISGAAVVGRLFLRKSKQEDVLTWKIWSLWLLTLYALPLLKSSGAFESTSLKENFVFAL